MVVMALLLFKTETSNAYFGMFSTPEFIGSGLIAYFSIFSRGVGFTISYLSFESPWITVDMVAYTTCFYVWLPYSVRILSVFKKGLSLFTQSETITVTMVYYVFTFISVYFIFVEVNLLALISVVLL